MRPRKELNQAYANRILASLPVEEIARLAPNLHPVTFKLGDALLEDGRIVTDAYFLESGMASIVVETEDGKTVEASIVGRCGMVGIPILLGTESIPGRTFIQMPGFGFRIAAQDIRREFERPGEFRRQLLLYLQAQMVQTSQTAACNRLHEIEQRLARWLLLCRDRTDSDDLGLTQEFVGQMVGAPRTTVTLVVGVLERAGFIACSRSHIVILNRKGLEDAACECYRVIATEYARLHILS
jgi:CRP-like cAMP-binding protein